MSKSKHTDTKSEAESKIAQHDDEMFDPLGDLPSLAVMQAAAGAALKPRAVHYSRKEAADLQALDIDHSQWSAEGDSALNQLDWFSDRSCFEWAYEASRADGEALKEEDPKKWRALFERGAIEPRDSRGFLTARFTQWYREFCIFEPSSGYRAYSAEMWARGDFFGHQDPADKKPRGGKKGSEIQTKIVEWLISRILDAMSGRPDSQTSAGAIWRRIRSAVHQYSEESIDKFGYDIEWGDDHSKPDHNAGRLVFHSVDGGGKARSIQFEAFKKKVSTFKKKRRSE
jgi:hypothetical protein